MVPLNIIPSYSGFENQANGINSLFGTEAIDNASSDQPIRAIDYQVNNATTVKVINASIRKSSTTNYSIYRQWGSIIVKIRDITWDGTRNKNISKWKPFKLCSLW